MDRRQWLPGRACTESDAVPKAAPTATARPLSGTRQTHPGGVSTTVALASDEFLNCLTEQQIAYLRKHGHRRRWPTNRTVLHEGEHPREVLVILDGHVKITT